LPRRRTVSFEILPADCHRIDLDPDRSNSGESLVQSFPTFLAYFGPDVQLPVMSFIAAAAGFLMTIGRAPLRAITRWLEARKAKSKVS
jgi:hypothetical protein